MKFLMRKYFLAIKRYFNWAIIIFLIPITLYLVGLMIEEIIHPLIVRLTGIIGDVLILIIENPWSIPFISFGLVIIFFALASIKLPTWDMVNTTVWNPILKTRVMFGDKKIDCQNGIKIVNNSGEDLLDFRADLIYISNMYEDDEIQELEERQRDFLSRELLPGELLFIADKKLIDENVTIRNGGELTVGLFFQDDNDNTFIRTKRVAFLKTITGQGYADIRFLARWENKALPPKYFRVYLYEKNQNVIVKKIVDIKNN